jgi:DinB superfamily
MQRTPALADFDRGRDEFLGAMEAAPDACLTFLKPGDIYSIGGLAVHCNWVLRHYLRVLDKLAVANPAEFRTEDPPEEKAEADRRALAGLQPAERAVELRTLATLHGDVIRRAMTIPDEAWEQKTNVLFGDSKEPYPTSPDDVLGWLRDHYREHVPQAADLIAQWRTSTDS